MHPFPPPHHGPRLPIPEISIAITLLGVIILLSKKPRFSFDIMFALFLTSLGFLHLGHLFGRWGGPVYFDFFHLTQILIGPLFFLYIKDISGKPFQKRDIWHLVPFLIYVSCFLILQIGEETEDKDRIYETFFHTRDSILKYISLFSLASYSVYSLWYVNRIRKDETSDLAYPIDVLDLRWTFGVLFLFFFIVSYHIVWGYIRSYYGHEVLPFLPPIKGFDVLTFTFVISIFGVRQNLLYSAWLLGHESIRKAAPKKKYKKSGLTESKLNEYAASIQKYMENQKPYRDGDFSLDDLSSALGKPRSHLTQSLSEVLETNFYQFVNEYRVREIISEMEANRSGKINLLHLALQNGFNSKSTFNDSFKRVTGKSPSDYLKEKSLKNES
ncbi:helix-turn-helix domain-containing protein [Leptospira idonii]|uniref:AraC family transcriptional regulator n=1 Tax=Leptospira idonii TaxID=1193500 RepID=A0A4R9M1P4_9LEPT|nr:AraC family transcriptional regulator [Leptospira idonii]TGN19992.1 AraC family transcriptional regulator [Leptospira idonii]